jgi:hypothetical protein
VRQKSILILEGSAGRRAAVELLLCSQLAPTLCFRCSRATSSAKKEVMLIVRAETRNAGLAQRPHQSFVKRLNLDSLPETPSPYHRCPFPFSFSLCLERYFRPQRECGISGCLGYVAPIDCTHRIIRAVLGVMFDGTLYCDTPVKDIDNKRSYIGDGCEGQNIRPKND